MDEADDGLTMEVVPQETREGDTYWRAEVRRDGTLIDSSLPTLHPRAAIEDGRALLREHRDDLPDYLPIFQDLRRHRFPIAS